MTESGSADRNRVGETAVLVAIEEVEPLIDQWRQRYDRAAAAGVPPHVTLLYPFLNIDRIDADILGTLRALIGGHRAFDIRFEQCARFPELLYLAPTPEQPFRDLTDALVARWPEVPPYGGQYDDLIPHLTVIQDQQPDVLDAVEVAIAGQLPVTARVSSAQLLVCDGSRWTRKADFPLLG